MKKFVLSLLAVILLLGILGCSQKEEVYSVPTVTYTSSGEPIIMAQPAKESSSLFGGWGDKGNDAAMLPEVVVNVPPATTTVLPSNDSYYNNSSSIPTERMVIKSASMALVVEDITATLMQITNLAAVNGGYIVNSDMREEQNRLYANISFRVDAAKFNETIQALRDLAVDVRSESTSGQDVTEEYVDLNAKLRNLEASEAQLLELMKKAGTVEEILKVQQELVNTREEIEQIKGRMQYLEQSSSLSFVYASLEQSKLTAEFIAYPSIAKEGKRVQFNPTISGGFEPYSFEWNFGDGETSMEGAPSHGYKKVGAYTVTLTIKDDKGTIANAERKDYITVLSGWDAGNIVSSAWNGLVGFGRFLGTVLIGLGIFSPVWIAILVILYFVWWRRRKKKA
jgi:hypothetical protein